MGLYPGVHLWDCEQIGEQVSYTAEAKGRTVSRACPRQGHSGCLKIQKKTC